MSNFENPYQTPHESGQPDDYRPDLSGKVKGPAISFIVLAVIGIIFILIDFGFRMFNLSTGNVMVLGDQPGARDAAIAGGWIGAGVDVIALICQGVVVYGALNMLKMRNYGSAMTACIISCVPCVSACCVLGIPFGIWGLVVLKDPAVKAAFRD